MSDDIPTHKSAKLKCGHRMCHSCLKRAFRLSVKDPQHMPPKCCTSAHIPLKHVDRLFDTDFKKTWNRKFAEYLRRTESTVHLEDAGSGSDPRIYILKMDANMGSVVDARPKSAACAIRNGMVTKTVLKMRRRTDSSKQPRRPDGNGAITVGQWSSSRKAAII